MVPESAPTATATLAGGCFWCVQADLEKVPGVLEVVSGYTGGPDPDVDYERVSAGDTGHYEAVQVVYDPARVAYARILDVFLRHIDPTDPGGQFADRGDQYRTAVFFHDADQKRQAEAALAALDASGRFHRPVVTAVLPFSFFVRAEAYHQGYARNNPGHYQRYRRGSGRAGFLETVWGTSPAAGVPPAAEAARAAEAVPTAAATGATWRDFVRPDEEALRRRLSPLAFAVTRRQGTEPPFANPYWDAKAPGIYVDVVSGEPLFASRDKFDSGTGWPSFSRPLVPDNLVTRRDDSLFEPRVEVRSRRGDTHLGHVFPDGPPPEGLRYCMNSAALRFVPREAMVAEGYGEFLEAAV